MPLQGWSEEMSDKNNLKNDSRKDWTEASPRPYEGFVGRKLKVKGPTRDHNPHHMVCCCLLRHCFGRKGGERETGLGAFCVRISRLLCSGSSRPCDESCLLLRACVCFFLFV